MVLCGPYLSEGRPQVPGGRRRLLLLRRVFLGVHHVLRGPDDQHVVLPFPHSKGVAQTSPDGREVDEEGEQGVGVGDCVDEQAGEQQANLGRGERGGEGGERVRGGGRGMKGGGGERG